MATRRKLSNLGYQFAGFNFAQDMEKAAGSGLFCGWRLTSSGLICVGFSVPDFWHGQAVDLSGDLAYVKIPEFWHRYFVSYVGLSAGLIIILQLAVYGPSHLP